MSVWRALLLGLVLAIGGSIAGYFHLVGKAERQLERVASRLVQTGRLSWDTVIAHPRGEIRVSRLRFQPHDSRDPFDIDELTLQADNLLALLATLTDLDRSQLPHATRLRWRGARIPVNRHLDAWLGANMELALPHATAACPGHDSRRILDLNLLDYWELEVSGHAAAQRVVQGEELDLNLNLALRGLGDWVARIRLKLDQPSGTLAGLTGDLAAAHWIRLELSFAELGYYTRLLRWCSEQAGLEPGAWIDLHLGQWRLAWGEDGLLPSQITESAYRAFLEQPGIVQLEAWPEPPLPVQPLQRQRLAELLERGNGTIRINDSVAVPLRFDLAPQRTRPTPPPAPAAAPEQAPPMRTPAPLMPEPDDDGPRIPRGWTAVSLSEAEAHIGQSVRLLMLDDSVVRGQLVDVDEEQLHLSIRSRFGLLVRPYPRDRIGQLVVPESAAR